MATESRGWVLPVFRDIKIAHSLFALPFALMATLLATRSVGFPRLREVILVVLAMFGARTWAMVVNRVADARIDAANPRTRGRALPAGQVALGVIWAWGLSGAALFLVASFFLSPLAFLCAVPVLLILGSYSYAKRLTWLCHYWLGFCLGLAPLGAWLALTGTLKSGIVILGAAITFWVAGFDIVYALQDETFDREKGLNSIPAAFGAQSALWISRVNHLLSGGLFGVAGLMLGLGKLYAAGLTVALLLLIWQHLALVKRGTAAIPFAFFHLNAGIAVLLFVVTWADLYFAHHF